MTDQIDWAAPVEPGRGMLGLTLGLPMSAVVAMLGENDGAVTFSNSPKLTVDSSKEGVVFLRAADLRDCPYDWQNIFAILIFENSKLACIVVHGDRGNDAYAYKGRLFGKIALGSQVSDLLDFGPIEYDDAEEVFFSDQWNGIEIGGAGACDLSTNPTQPVTSFKVFAVK